MTVAFDELSSSEKEHVYPVSLTFWLVVCNLDL